MSMQEKKEHKDAEAKTVQASAGFSCVPAAFWAWLMPPFPAEESAAGGRPVFFGTAVMSDGRRRSSVSKSVEQFQRFQALDPKVV